MNDNRSYDHTTNAVPDSVNGMLSPFREHSHFVADLCTKGNFILSHLITGTHSLPMRCVSQRYMWRNVRIWSSQFAKWQNDNLCSCFCIFQLFHIFRMFWSTCALVWRLLKHPLVVFQITLDKVKNESEIARSTFLQLWEATWPRYQISR